MNHNFGFDSSQTKLEIDASIGQKAMYGFSEQQLKFAIRSKFAGMA